MATEDDFARTFARFTMPTSLTPRERFVRIATISSLVTLVSLPLAALVVWFWPTEGAPTWRPVVLFLAVVLLPVVAVSTFRGTRRARARNSALNDYLDQVREAVRRRVLDTHVLSSNPDTVQEHHLRELFFEEMKKRLPIPGLPGSAFFARAFIMAGLRTRVAELMEALRAEGTE